MKLIQSRVSIAVSTAVLGLALATTYAAHAAGSSQGAGTKAGQQRLIPVAFELCVPEPGGHIPLTKTAIYADPGSLVTIDVSEVPAVNGRFCLAMFSGQLLK